MAFVWRAKREDLDPAFVAAVEAALGPLRHTFYILSGYRSIEEQRVLYRKYLAGGAKAAPPGKSAHNYRLAVDVVLDASDQPGLQPSWVITLAGWLALFVAVDADKRLKSGRSFNDSPHIEWRAWKDAIPKAA